MIVSLTISAGLLSLWHHGHLACRICPRNQLVRGSLEHRRVYRLVSLQARRVVGRVTRRLYRPWVDAFDELVVVHGLKTSYTDSM